MIDRLTSALDRRWTAAPSKSRDRLLSAFIASALLLAGCTGLSKDGQDPIGEPGDSAVTRGRVLDANFSDEGLYLIPVVLSGPTSIRGTFHFDGKGSHIFAIMYLSEGSTGYDLRLIHKISAGPFYSSSKKVNEQAGTYEEQCLDGQVRSSRTDPPCTLTDRLQSKAGPFNFSTPDPNLGPAGPGRGYILITLFRTDLSVSVVFEQDVTWGAPIKVSDVITPFSMESFEGKFIDISTCWDVRFCGVVYDADLGLKLRPHTFTFVQAIGSAGPAGYFEFCQERNGIDRDCGDQSRDAVGVGSNYYQVLGPSVESARFTLTAFDFDPSERIVFASMAVRGHYASFNFPPTFPISTDP